MAAKAHNGNVNAGDIVGYEGVSKRFYGYRLIKEIYVSEIGDYVWISDAGSARDGEDFKGSGDPSLLRSKELEGTYSSRYTKDVVLKDGDILRDSSGTQVFMVRGTMSYQNVQRLYRLTGGHGAYDSLGNYEARWGKLTQVNDQNGKRFSEV